MLDPGSAASVVIAVIVVFVLWIIWAEHNYPKDSGDCGPWC